MFQSIKNLSPVKNYLCKRYWRRLITQGKRISQNRSIPAMSDPIDFVVTWVDGTDPSWQAEKERYEQAVGSISHRQDNNPSRYRDWDIFKYWFRTVEKYAPWVNNIYLVTSGQVPSWLNENAPKLKLITHKDIMPESALPTFNSCAIECNLHNIESLSEHFVYFNDDVFLNRPALPEDFFQDSLPNHSAIAFPIKNINNGAHDHQRFTALGSINYHFKGQIHKQIVKYPEKWFASQYGHLIDLNVYAAKNDILPGMYFTHLAAPFLKSTFEKVWRASPELMKQTTMHRFRHPQDTLHQIFSMWDIMEGNFHPVSLDHHGKGFWNPFSQLNEIVKTIQNKQHLTICINDSEFTSFEEYTVAKQVIHDAFERVFPDKSAFEK